MISKLALTAATITVLAGCHTDMWVQQKFKPLQENDFFVDKAASRPPVPGTVQFGKPDRDSAFMTGFENGRMVARIPSNIVIDKKALLQGQERFNAFCSQCHGKVGDGKGMIAQRGFTLARPVASYHTDRLRAMPDGHFFDVITNGYGAMYPQASKHTPEERWKIVAYIRALQLSQYQDVSDLTPEQMEMLRSGGEKADDHAEGSH